MTAGTVVVMRALSFAEELAAACSEPLVFGGYTPDRSDIDLLVVVSVDWATTCSPRLRDSSSDTKRWRRAGSTSAS